MPNSITKRAKAIYELKREQFEKDHLGRFVATSQIPVIYF